MILLAHIAPTCHRKILRAAHYGGHVGFVALAGAEVFHAIALLYYVNIVLLVTGVGAVLYEKVSDEK